MANRKKSLTQLANELRDVLNHMDDVKKDFENMLAETIAEELDEIFSKCIRDWYHSYKPIFYHRQYSLLKAYKFTYKNHILECEFSPEFISMYHHRISSQYGMEGLDYLFDITFNRGWHGGADWIRKSKEADWGVHPKPGTPWYRTPHPSMLEDPEIEIPYREWSDYHAKWSTAPRTQILKQVKLYEKGKTTITGNTMSQKKIDDTFKLALYKYDLFG